MKVIGLELPTEPYYVDALRNGELCQEEVDFTPLVQYLESVPVNKWAVRDKWGLYLPEVFVYNEHLPYFIRDSLQSNGYRLWLQTGGFYEYLPTSPNHADDNELTQFKAMWRVSYEPHTIGSTRPVRLHRYHVKIYGRGGEVMDEDYHYYHGNESARYFITRHVSQVIKGLGRDFMQSQILWSGQEEPHGYRLCPPHANSLLFEDLRQYTVDGNVFDWVGTPIASFEMVDGNNQDGYYPLLHPDGNGQYIIPEPVKLRIVDGLYYEVIDDGNEFYSPDDPRLQLTPEPIRSIGMYGEGREDTTLDHHTPMNEV